MLMVLSVLYLFSSLSWAQSLTGVWDATINFNGTIIPFKLELAGEGSKVTGSFLNGTERNTSTSGKFEQESLLLRFDDYGAILDATLNDTVLEGQYGPFQKKFYSIQARKHADFAAPNSEAPAIGGLWEIAGISGAFDENAWHLIVRQSNSSVSAVIVRAEGDTGEIAGIYKDGKFTLGHFSGARPSLLVLTPKNDGTLSVRLSDLLGSRQFTAFRANEAQARNWPNSIYPTQPVLNGKPESFQFRFPDLSGRLISSSDPRFRKKVLLVNVSGSWSPNCHDQAPFLTDLYRRFRNQGFEIVSLTFEEADQLKDASRLRAFVKKFGIEYPVLIAGAPEERTAKLQAQASGSSWPTTLLIGRDGLIRSIQTGFPSPASGDFYEKAKGQVTAQVEQLLAEGSELTRK